jgi:flagellar M-ring protein FliF
MRGTIKGLSTLVREIILSAIITVITGCTILTVPVINAPIRDQGVRDRIVARIKHEGVKTSVSDSGIIMVADKKTAMRIRTILIREDLIPQGTDPWAIFDCARWTFTDLERNVNIRRSIGQIVTDHIKALDEVDDASVSIIIPRMNLFASEQNPTTANVIIFPKPGSDIVNNRKKIEGVQKIIKYAVEGLEDENIVITNHHGFVLNDFGDTAETE